MKRSLWIIASLLLGSWMVYSQQYQLEGRIVNEKKEALPGATVMLFANDSVVAGAACNEKGVFRIDGISAGSFLARFSSLGYKQLEQVLTVSKNLKLTDVSMEEDAQSLSEVVVSADKRDLISTKAGASTFYLSDHIRKDAQNAYEALREVPKLIVDATNRKLMLSDGSSPVILINGVNRPNYINSLDPQDIEAVEVIENPSARYGGNEDVRSVINLKVKKKKNLYTSFNIYTKQNPELVYGVSGASFEVGNSKASLFINAQQFYFNNDKRETMDNIQSGTVVRNLDGKGTYDANMISLSMGADWLLTEKNYFSLGAEYITNPSKLKNNQTGTVLEAGMPESPLQVVQQLNNDYYTNVYSLYYKHTFTSDQYLEATGKYGLFGSGSNGWRSETSDIYSYKNLIDMDNKKQSLSLELNYDLSIPDKVGFNVGANTYLQETKLDDITDAFPVFDYKGAQEYIYADVRNLTKSKLSYMASLGVDMVFINAGGVTSRYINFMPSASLSYGFNSKNVLQLSFSRNRISPSVSYLNPRNTSTDSLLVTVGNPYLKPAISNNLRLSYAWSSKGVYLEPYVKYSYYSGLVQATGSVDGGVYTQTYANKNRQSVIQSGLTGRVNLGEWGNLNATVYYEKSIYKNMPFSGDAIGGNVNLYLSYKKVSLNAFMFYSGYSYSLTSKLISTPQSEVTLTWRLPKGWNLNAGIRDMGKSYYRTWTEDVDYSAYSRMDNRDRGWMPLIGVSYYFHSKQQQNRNTKRMYNSDEGLQIKVK